MHADMGAGIRLSQTALLCLFILVNYIWIFSHQPTVNTSAWQRENRLFWSSRAPQQWKPPASELCFRLTKGRCSVCGRRWVMPQEMGCCLLVCGWMVALLSWCLFLLFLFNFLPNLAKQLFVKFPLGDVSTGHHPYAFKSGGVDSLL